jgi:8-oxo-dGTP pyrophosphatase MutT (NUDIX family)
VSTIREAASVILLREAASGFEVFFLRRHRSASFMASAYVFPGGATEEGEDAKTAAARELFEEAGVLLARDGGAQNETLQVMSQDSLRHKILEGASAAAMLELAGLKWATEGLVPWSHWITPSVETKRFSARFFIGELPAGQHPTFDATETVDQVWVTPAEGLARAAELALPPPQVRTLWELAQLHTLGDVREAAKQRAEEPHPIMPRLAPPLDGETGPMLLLPWDREYNDRGTGEATPLTYQPSWAVGPSRFKFSHQEWKHFSAP